MSATKTRRPAVETKPEPETPVAERRVAEPEFRRPRPFVRQVMTVTPPWDAMGPDPVTVQVIMLADGLHDDDVSATHEDLPELEEAGWSRRSLGAVDVYTRVIF